MTLDNIKALYNEGDRETGRAQLIELLEAEPENAKAWAYLGAKSTDLEQRKYCYLKSLEFEPDNATIQTRLDKLDEYDPVAPPEFELTDEDEEEEDPIPPELVAVKKGVKGVKNDGGMSTFQKLTLAIFSFVAICIMGSLGVVMVYVVSDGKGLLQVQVIAMTTPKPLPTPTEKYVIEKGKAFYSNCIADKLMSFYEEDIARLDRKVGQLFFNDVAYGNTFAMGEIPREGIWEIDRVYDVISHPSSVPVITFNRKKNKIVFQGLSIPLITFDGKTNKVIDVGDGFRDVLTSAKYDALLWFDASNCDDFVSVKVD